LVKERLNFYTRRQVMQIDVIDAKKTAMIVVDMQNDFVAAGAAMETPAARAVVPKLAEALNICREVHIKVIYTAHVHRRDGCDMGLFDDMHPPIANRAALVDGTPGVDIYPELAPAPGEHVIKKHRYSGFFETAPPTSPPAPREGWSNVALPGSAYAVRRPRLVRSVSTGVPGSATRTLAGSRTATHRVRQGQYRGASDLALVLCARDSCQLAEASPCCRSPSREAARRVASVRGAGQQVRQRQIPASSQRSVFPQTTQG
jgi:hypothetical protein